MKIRLDGFKGSTAIVIGLVAVAVLCCVVCCCTMFRPTVQEEIPEPETMIVIQDPPEEIELEGANANDYLPMVILFRCAICRQDREESHTVAIDGQRIGDVCDDCAQLVLEVFQR